MNKEQFLAQLSQRLDVLPAQDVQRMKEFFSETIDDRVESGMPEAEAVAALGDPDQIIQEILQENGGLPAAREVQPKIAKTASAFASRFAPFASKRAFPTSRCAAVRSRPAKRSPSKAPKGCAGRFPTAFCTSSATTKLRTRNPFRSAMR